MAPPSLSWYVSHLAASDALPATSRGALVWRTRLAPDESGVARRWGGGGPTLERRLGGVFCTMSQCWTKP
eukprot:684208-Prymnesium_polylepis.2